jgi:pSer/pThr/pTyr-binding forkhead associated (FHA) protein
VRLVTLAHVLRADVQEGGVATVVEQRELAGPVPSGASVRVMWGFFEGLELPVDRDWMVIGRGRGADLLITEPTISRAHAAIGYDGEEFFVEDLGSTNGTSVNGKRKPRATLNTGDEIQLGKLRLRVTLPQAR